MTPSSPRHHSFSHPSGVGSCVIALSPTGVSFSTAIFPHVCREAASLPSLKPEASFTHPNANSGTRTWWLLASHKTCLPHTQPHAGHQCFSNVLFHPCVFLFTTITDDTVPTYQSPTYPVNPNYKLLLFQNSGKPDPFSPLSLQMSESQSKLPSLPLFTGEQRKKKKNPVSTVSPMSNSWFMFYVSIRPCSNKGFVCYLLLSSCLK